ncbi:TAXI family TRAP transporter solute-binding subunit [Paralimibaculum aggregatum]|uniref:TAXI family TRAP transporter solute-binding subunit n=1 Tax=Paralimibaculum aggregatum TaxID=3036245 RepID=A0ABQ6LMP6_9RHOB|nr:TAXI family TRAP transporter solute-binding subunit [Limibaculum sp. NKW23]GMG82103.1 TAXI family TRAP transporter solute-binding subunit [Limibaculum sp. NKW23]
MGMLAKALGSAALGLFCLSGAVAAQELPKKLTWMAYQTTSSGYAQTVAIGNMLKQRHGTAVRVLPGKNDVSRMAPLRDRKAEFCSCGATVWMGQEGVYMFADKEWGPQPLRMLMSAFADTALTLMVTESSGIETFADIRGKRVTFVTNSDSVNWSFGALLAFGGLTWDDVEIVRVSGTGADYEAVLNGKADVVFASTVSPLTQKVAASSYGLKWLRMPHDDTEAWARLQKKAPYFVPTMATVGTLLSEDAPLESSNYPYPILTTNADQDADIVYALVKSMSENLDDYRTGAKGADGWAVENQRLQWAIPFHEGAVRYWKEIGVWTEADQAHNDRLIARQEVLLSAWAEYSEAAADRSGEAFREGWLEARKAALTAAGLPVVFD